MNKVYVGVDTSNYTTSVAVCDHSGSIIANLKAPLTVRSGMRGLRQSDAVFEHIKNIQGIMQRLEGVISGKKIEAVGVSVRPRDAEGSYMPCFLAGKSAAYSLAAGASAPVYEFSHQNGHVAAAMYSSGTSLYLMISIFSPRSSSTIAEILIPWLPIQAPTGSTSASLEQTAILVLEPASRETPLTRTTPSWISGTSSSNIRRTRPG